MQNKSCLSLIKAEYAHLTKKERQLADYILKNCEAVVSMTVSALAENAGVVKSVVIRFCQTLGFGGYTEFKLLLSRDLARNEQLGFSPYISNDDNSQNVFKKIFAANVKTLHDTARDLDGVMFEKVVDAIKKAENIYVYGVGTSAGIASDFQYRLVEIGRNALFFTDVVNMKVSAMNIKSKDVVVGISNSGRTVPTVDALKHAQENGAKTVCVTSYPKSEIIKYSDFPLVITTDEIHYPAEAISARIAHISVLDSIAVALSLTNREEAESRAVRNHDVIEQLRY